MTEMPPNASFTFAWILALSGGFSGLHVPQWTRRARDGGGDGGPGAPRRREPDDRALHGRSRPDVAAHDSPDGLVADRSPRGGGRARARSSSGSRDGFRSAQESRGDVAYFGLAVRPGHGNETDVLVSPPRPGGSGFQPWRSWEKRAGEVAAGRTRGRTRLCRIRRLQLRPESRGIRTSGCVATGLRSPAHRRAVATRPAGQRAALPRAGARLAGSRHGGTEASVVRAQDAAFSALAQGLGRDASVREMRAAFLRARWMPDEELSGFGPVGFLVGPRLAGRPRACATRLPEEPGSRPPRRGVPRPHG